MAIFFDTSDDSLHLQVFAGRFSYADVDAHFSELESYYLRMASTYPSWRPALFADMSKAKIDARGRQRISECFARLGPVMGPRLVAHAIFVKGKIGSGALTAVLWLQRPPWPIQAFSDPEEANRWILKRYAEERLTVPSPPSRWWERARPAAQMTAR